MNKQSNAMRNITLALSLLIVTALLLSSMASFVDVPSLAFFWYLALAGMAAMVLMTAVLTIDFLWSRITRSAKKMLEQQERTVPAHGHSVRKDSLHI